MFHITGTIKNITFLHALYVLMVA